MGFWWILSTISPLAGTQSESVGQDLAQSMSKLARLLKKSDTASKFTRNSEVCETDFRRLLETYNKEP